MNAYTGTIGKEEFVAELKKHQEADNFVRGRYFRDGKGCAVGCSLESISRLKGIQLAHDDHAQYPEHLGIPEWLARLEDTLFEGMSAEKSKSWPVDFAEAISVGADLERAKTPFIVMVLEHTLTSMDAVKFDADKFPEVAKAIAGSKAAVKEMIEAQKSGDERKIAAARSAAWSAARSAARSAESAAWSAWSAARSAARSAESAAWSAWSAGWSAAESAAAESAAAYDYYASRLLEILRGCK